MRNLVLLRGAAGCGKSTFIQKHGLERYTICPDNLRLLFQSPIMTVDGEFEISNKNDKQVWNLLFTVLEKRMERGEFTVVDATHARASFLAQYKTLLDRYRYRGFVVKFDVPVDEVLNRNKQRASYKWVPENVIREMCAKIATQPTPKYMKEITPEQFTETFQYRKTDVSHYKKIHFIGDIHGCYVPLQEYFYSKTNGGCSVSVSTLFPENELFVFVGDYFDRGIQNVEVFHFLLLASQLPNVILLEGNHEIHLKDWAWDGQIKSREFSNSTLPQFVAAGITTSMARQLVRKLVQIAYLDFHGAEILVTHGGLPVIPENLLYIDTNTLIHGVGGYKTDIDQIFFEKGKERQIRQMQIHGHRNLLEKELDEEFVHTTCRGSLNLENKVEFGGHLRIVTVHIEKGHPTWIPICIKNDVYKYDLQIEQNDTVEQIVESYIPSLKSLRKDSNVREKKLADGVSSFNFTKDTFYSKHWTNDSIKARGLFVDTDTGEIVARSYDKFFSIQDYLNGIRVK